MDYKSILERSIPHIKKGLKEFYRDQDKISPELFEANFMPLDDAAGTIDFNYNQPNHVFNHKMRGNLGFFAANKTLSEQKALTTLLIDKDGNTRSFTDFEAASKGVLKDYNRNWLAAEHKTTLRSARMATDWQDALANADIYPNGKYLPSRAAVPREEHAKLYNVVRPLNDPFWDKYFPPNGWQCLCGFKTTDEEVTAVPSDIPSPPAGFQNHVGKTAKVFDQDHPYYDEHYPDQRKMVTDFMEKNPMLIKHSDNVAVSMWADPSGLAENISAAEIVTKATRAKMIIREHIQGRKNPEFKYNNLLADLKTTTSLNVENGINAAKRQGCEVIIFNITGSAHTIERFWSRIKGNLTTRNSYAPKQIVIFKGEEVGIFDWQK